MTTSNNATATITLHLNHDFNDGRNEGGFHEVLVPDFLVGNIHPGDEVSIGDDELRVRGRVRCYIAVVEEIEEPS